MKETILLTEHLRLMAEKDKEIVSLNEEIAALKSELNEAATWGIRVQNGQGYINEDLI